MWSTISNLNQMNLQSSIRSYDESIRSSRLNDMILKKRLRKKENETPSEGEVISTSTVFTLSTPSVAPTRLASHYPSTSKPLVERTFNDLLAGYKKIERNFQVPPHDVAGAVAAFLAGSYMAYHNVDFPDEDFPPLVRQMRQVLGTSPQFARASNAEKQEMYEHLAILGMFMATTQMALKERPDAQLAANMRQAAKGYLEQFLKTDADRVKITRTGLVIQ